MFIHNKKKKLLLSIVNGFIEAACIPGRLLARKKTLENINPRNILLVRLDHIGDVVMTSPAFSIMRARFPQANIMLLTNSAGSNLYKDDTRFDQIHVFNWPWHQPKVEEGFSLEKLSELYKVIRNLRKQKIDIFVDFRGDLRFIFLFGVLTGAKFRMSNSRSGNSSLLDQISEFDVSRHEVERSAEVVGCFVQPNTVLRPTLYIHTKEIGTMRERLSNEVEISESDKIAIIGPYSSRDVKSWPPENFKQVIDHLVSERYKIIVVGAPGDRNEAETLIRDFELNVYSFAGKTTVRELAVLVSLSSLVIGVDTGVLHLAACFDVPIIALFGSTRSIEFRPYSPFAVIVDSGCCTCNQFLHVKCDEPVCGYAKCMTQIKPLDVVLEIEKLVPFSVES